MRLVSRALVVCALALASPLAFAQGACLVQGELYGAPFMECSEVDTADPSGAYKAQCESNVGSIRNAGGNATATVGTACPAGAGGVCENPMGQKVRTYYYARNAQMLAITQRSCESTGGTWRTP